MTQNTTIHESVLSKETVTYLAPKPGETLLDCTVNGGGHSKLLADAVAGDLKIIGTDLDSKALERASVHLEGLDYKLVQENFRNLDTVLYGLSVPCVDMILMDLGYSSDQLEYSGRGISFQKLEEPLSMTLGNDPSGYSFTAFDVINEWPEESLANVFFGYGEERRARTIAKAIIQSRETKTINTVGDLVSVIESVVPKVKTRSGMRSGATKVFQALRIVVNDELGVIEEALPKAFDKLCTGGRLAVISFHSLEDRIVKNYFRSLKIDKKVVTLTKKPVTAAFEELSENPRSRSAKLRIIKKL